MVVDGCSCRRLSLHLPSIADATTEDEFLAGGGSGGGSGRSQNMLEEYVVVGA
jgi:hypothetical protein